MFAHVALPQLCTPCRQVSQRCLQIPSPLALVVGGAWAGHLAGGRLPQATWPSNPQFMLSTQQRAQVMVSLVRADLRVANSKAPQRPEGAIGLAVLEVCHICRRQTCRARCGIVERKQNAQPQIVLIVSKTICSPKRAMRA